MADRKQLTFRGQHQERTNWCWAATARSVSHSYDSGSAFTQCSIAKLSTGCATCEECNYSFELVTPLTKTGNYTRKKRGSLTWEAVKAEISAGNIVCVRLAWDEEGGHFVSIYGFAVSARDGLNYLYVYDTALDVERVLINYDDFKRNYCNLGRWYYTFFTGKIQGAS